MLTVKLKFLLCIKYVMPIWVSYEIPRYLTKLGRVILVLVNFNYENVF